MPQAAEPASVARRLVETVPALAGVLRDLTMDHGPGDLRVPEWRWLYFLTRGPEETLAELAERYGRQPEEIGPHVERLVEAGVVARQPTDGGGQDPRLVVTDEGRRALGSAREAVATHLADRIAQMGPGTLASVTEALDLLEALLAGSREPEPGR